MRLYYVVGLLKIIKLTTILTQLQTTLKFILIVISKGFLYRFILLLKFVLCEKPEVKN